MKLNWKSNIEKLRSYLCFISCLKPLGLSVIFSILGLAKMISFSSVKTNQSYIFGHLAKRKTLFHRPEG